MIPKKLILEGFISYKNRTEINFDFLTQDNVFGIFGPIGSGKSTILDAICFALFDENYRNLDQHELITLGKNEFYLEFHFTYKNDNYCIIKKLKNKNKTKNGTLYKNNELISDNISEIKKEIQNLLKLDYKKFIKTIIIPQGTYRNLLEEKDYYGLLKDYMGIPDITIPDKIKEYKTHLENELKKKEAVFHQYKDIHQELIDILENQLKETHLSLDKHTPELNNLVIEFNKKQEISNHFKRLEELKYELENHNKNSSEIQNLKNEIEFKEKIYLDFHTLFQQKYSLVKKIDENEKKIQQETQNQSEIQKQINQLEQQIELMINQESEITHFKEILQDYQVLEKILIYQNQLSNFKNQIIKNQNLIQENENKIKDFNQNLLKKQKELNAIEEELKNYSLEEFIKIQDLSQRLLNLKNEIQTCINKILKTLEKPMSDNEWDEEKMILLHQNIKLSIQNEEIQIKLHDLGVSLKEGEPCILCGSTHHPNKLNSIDLNQSQKKLKKLKEIDHILASSLEKYKISLINFEENLQILESYPIIYDCNSIKEVEQLSKNWIKKINDLQNNLNTISNNINELKVLITKYEQENISLKNQNIDLEKKINEISEEIEKHKSELKQNWDIDKLSIIQIKGEKNRLEKSIKEHENQKTQLNSQLAEWKEKKAGIDSYVSSLQELLKNNNEELKNLNQEINEKLASYKDIQEEDIEKIIQNYDPVVIKNVKQKIENFNKKTNELYGKIKEYEEKTKNKNPVSDETIKQLKENINTLENEIENLKKKANQLEKEIELNKRNLENKKNIEKEIQLLENKKNIVNQFDRACFSNGFKNFIVEIYLEDFIKEVNKNLRLLNQEDFELIKEWENEKSILKVEDHKNGGIKRNLGSLSGGQSFLAAFAIGLTISEQMNKNKNNEKSFFFIDEGFGSLDSESLQQVKQLIFTLKNQNRIIGIITHVNELQECISQKIVLERKNEGTKVNYL